MKKRIILITAHAIGLAIVLFFVLRGCSHRRLRPVLIVPAPSPAASVAPTLSSSTLTVAPTPEMPPALPARPAHPKPPKPPVEIKAALPPAPAAVPSPVKIYKELIPKDIEIVRVYYENSITGPASSIPFDINGSGFTKEFEQMITAESGNPKVDVKDLRLITLNQIHGVLVVNPDAATGVSYPQILINGKVVFRAPEPFAVIRPGEVLNLIFTEMGENGRSGRFRVFTNLTEGMFKKFTVAASSPSIQVSDLSPQLPFVVDGILNIGRAEGGTYGLRVTLDGKQIWSRDGLVRVVRPNLGQSGLIQRLQAADGFQRPGDQAKFVLLGSGFQPQDASVLRVNVKGWATSVSTFSYIAPGRMEMRLTIPLAVVPGSYELSITNGADVLLNVPNAFSVVDKNWTRGFSIDPPLTPGGSGQLMLAGRDLEKDFVSSIKTDVDESGLHVGSFVLKSPSEATATVSAAATVAPGDYLLKMTSNGKPVAPKFGSIIQVLTAK